MIRNYFLASVRSLRRYAGFALINTVGLGVAISAALLIILFVRDQSGKDRFHEQAADIYRVYSDFKSVFNRDNALYATSPSELAALIDEEIPGVARTVRLRGGFDGTVVYRGEGLPVSGLYADPDFLRVFSFELAAGDPESALAAPGSIVLSPAMAARFFGASDPLGEVLALERGGNFTVTGVLARDDYPTHLPLSALVSHATLDADTDARTELNDWTRSIYGSYTYLLLEPDAVPARIQERIDRLIPLHFAERDDNRLHALVLQPLSEINLGTAMGNEIGVVVPRLIADFLSALAIVILLTACFNYVGLTASRALRCAREVGVRKLFGARRRQVFIRFLTEALMVSTAATALGVGLLVVLVPAFNRLMFVTEAGARLRVDFGSDPGVYLVFGLFAVAVAVVAGSYPAWYLSRFRPARVVKGLAELSGGGGSRLRKSLVVVQFTLSVIFIVLAATMYRQSRFMLHADYGFAQEDLLNVRLGPVPYTRFRQELSRSANIETISGTDPLPALGSRKDRWLKVRAGDDPVKGYVYFIDEHFIGNLGLSLVAGRNVSPERADDANRTVIVNETLLKSLGLGQPALAVGRTFIVGDSTEMEIAGVVKDYQSGVISSNTTPNYLQYAPNALSWANVRVAPGRQREAETDIRAAWTAFGTNTPLEFERFDVQLRNSYSNLFVKDMLRVVGFFTVLAVIIACLGMLGVAAHNVERRTREISIRKALGATTFGVLKTLSREFLTLMAVSLVLAVPAAWMLSTAWLDEFATRVAFGPGTLLAGVGAVVTLALVVTGTQTFRAAAENPVAHLQQD